MTSNSQAAYLGITTFAIMTYANKGALFNPAGVFKRYDFVYFEGSGRASKVYICAKLSVLCIGILQNQALSGGFVCEKAVSRK